MDKNQQELFKMILEEVLINISEKEMASLIDTFISIYEEKFGIKIDNLEDSEPVEQEIYHTREATEYLKRFTK